MYITRKDRSALIRLASVSTPGSEDRREILRFVKSARSYQDYVSEKEERGEKPLDEKAWEARVKGVGEAEPEEKPKGEGGEEKPKGGFSKALSGWINKAKGLASAGKEALSKMSEEAQKVVHDPEARKKLTSSIAEHITSSPKKAAQHLAKHFKKELHEVSGGVKKIMSGQKPSKHEAKAMASLAVEMAAASLSVGTAGVAGASLFFGKSVVKHIALAAINPVLGDLYILAEAKHIGHGLGALLEIGGAAAHHLANEKRPRRAAEDLSDEDAENAFVNFVVSAVAKKMKEGISDKEMVEILNGVKPPVDSDKIKSEDDEESEPKKAASDPIRLLGRAGVKNVQTHWKRRDALVGTLTHGGFKEGGSTVVYDFSSISDMPLPRSAFDSAVGSWALQEGGASSSSDPHGQRGGRPRQELVLFSREHQLRLSASFLTTRPTTCAWHSSGPSGSRPSDVLAHQHRSVTSPWRVILASLRSSCTTSGDREATCPRSHSS